MSEVASRHFAEQVTIDKGTQIAVGNHDSHIKNLEDKFQAAKIWWDNVAKETGDNLQSLDNDFANLGSIKARADFVDFIAKEVRLQKLAHSGRRVYTLQDYVDADALKKAASTSRRVKESFGRRIADMRSQLAKVSTDYNELRGGVSQGQSRSFVDDSAEEPGKLYSEIEAVAKKVNSDLQHVLGLAANPKSVAQVSKMALLHTRNFLPAIKEYGAEMSDLVRRSVEQKNHALENAVHSMRSIAGIESTISSLSAELDSIDVPQDGIAAFELISLVGRLPYIYGTLLVEAVRRREWVEKMKRDTSSLAEEMATYQEEEDRRRKRWLKPIADVVNIEAVQGNSLGFEMNVQDRNNWPEISREDLHDYLSQLQNIQGQEADADALLQAIKDLDRPTKQQVKRAKIFKMGSVHEASFGKGSQLLLRGDDDVRVLKEANAKLEEEMKTYKSRVRRLEDLLHRSNHVHRLSIGDGAPSFRPQSPDPSTPIMETASGPRLQGELSRRSSVSSRRFSTNQGDEDKRRILRLEQELAAEKKARAALEKDAQSKLNIETDLRQQLEEAVQTKQNIMENMKAQQREFSNERRSLEEEIQTYKGKIEEAEDELDRILGSRDNERADIDIRIQDLVAELENTRKKASENAKRAQEKLAMLQAEVDSRRDAEAVQKETLSATFRHLSTGGDVLPTDHDVLISQLEDLALRTTNHCADLQRAVALVQSENEATKSRAQEQEADLKSRLSKEEANAAALREQLNTEKAKISSVTAELEEERGHLHDLREKFAEGETGSEALRKRVEEEENKVGRLQLELVESNSHANALDVELMNAMKKIAKYEEQDSARSHQRAVRAKEISERLYSQQGRLLRLLESLGFIVTYEDGVMVLQRESRMKSSTTMGTDANGLYRATSASPPTPMKRQLEANPDLSFLQWAESTKPEEEDEKYSKFMHALSLFDVDTFSDAVSKRMRDMEHTARKWQREARGYRDKSHRFQAEAHEKIAFRSFKEGDLALFLPTRNQATRPWAAFNVGAPHYFLREQESHRLHGREWLVARIGKVEERIVDLSKAIDSNANRASIDGRSITSNSAVSFEDDNPFELSDGLRWYLLDAVEEKPGAPGTPGLGKTTVASARVTGQGHMEPTKKKGSNDPAKTLGKSLDSRRSSQTSRKSVPIIGQRPSAEALANADGAGSDPNSTTATRGVSPASRPGPSHLRESTEAGGSTTATATMASSSSNVAANLASRLFSVGSSAGRTSEAERASRDVGEEVRKDLLWGP